MEIQLKNLLRAMALQRMAHSARIEFILPLVKEMNEIFSTKSIPSLYAV